MSPRPGARLRRTAVVSATVAALVLSGCGGSGPEAEPEQAAASPSAAVPTGDVEVPEGLSLTEPGTELAFGEEATVAYEANPKRKSVLSLAVTSVREGRIADFSAYDLKPRTRRSRPYYVRYAVKNIGDGDLSRVDVPLLAEDDRSVLIQSSSFSNTFERCPSTPLPAQFSADEEVKGCLVFLVPDGGRLEAMSYRPLQAFAAITWDGRIAPPEQPKKKQAKKDAKKKTKKKKGGS